MIRAAWITGFVRSLLLGGSCAALLLSATSPAVAVDGRSLPQVSEDGLQLASHTRERIVYAKPGADFEQYTEVMLVDCYVEFRKNWQKDYNLSELGLEGRVTDRDADRIRKEVAEQFRKEFTKVLSDRGHAVVDAPGPGVLLLRPAIINLDVTAPDLMTASMRTVVAASAGSMTLYLELYDAPTSDLLARVVDSKADPNTFAQRTDRVTNIAAADRILRSWAEELATHRGTARAATGGSGR